MLTDILQANSASGTRVVKLMTEHVVPAGSGVSLLPYTEVDGYGHVSITLQFDQQTPDEPAVDLGVAFALDAAGAIASRRYVNLEDTAPVPRTVRLMEVPGAGSWHGSPYNISSFTVRLPVLGPFMQIFVYNHAVVPRKVSAWAYLAI